MKIRLDFVTNSSSSSFVIVLDKRPNSIEEFYAMVYGSYKYGDTGLLLRILDDMPKESVSEAKIFEEFKDESWYYRDHGWDNTSWQDVEKYNKAQGVLEAQKFIDEYQGKFIFLVEYEDSGDNMEGRLSEGMAYNKIVYTSFSHH